MSIQYLRSSKLYQSQKRSHHYYLLPYILFVTIWIHAFWSRPQFLTSFFEIVWPHYPSSIYRHLLNYSSFPAKAGELIGSLDTFDRSTWLERWPKPRASVHIGLWSRWQPLIANVERKCADRNLICCQAFDLRDTQNLGFNLNIQCWKIYSRLENISWNYFIDT